MAADAEGGTHDAFGHRLADEKFLRALAVLVIVVDETVVWRLVTVEFLRLAADRERGVQHVVVRVGARLLLFACVEYFKGVARLHAPLKIDVVRINTDETFDNRLRHVVSQRRFIDALIETDAAALVLVGLWRILRRYLCVDVANVDGYVFAHV